MRQARSQLASTQSQMREARSKLQGIKDQLGDTKNQISEGVSRLESFEKQIDGANEKITDISLSLSLLQGTLHTTLTKNPEGIIAPVDIVTPSIFQNQTFLNLLLPVIISSIIMLNALPLSSVSIIREKNKKTLIRNMVSPTSLKIFIMGKVISILLIVALQLVLFLTIGMLFFKVQLPLTLLPHIIVSLVLITLCFISIGMIIAVYSDSETSALITSTALVVPMLFLSGAVIPFEMMPGAIEYIGSALPLTHSIALMKSITIYQSFTSLKSVIYLLEVTVIAFIVSFVMIKKQV
jgi:ABC-2 type transport system permease protein